MRLIELYAPLYIQRSRRELPDGAVQLRWPKACCNHGVEEVGPGDFAGLAGLVRIVEEGFECFEGALADGDGGLDVWDVSRKGLIIFCFFGGLLVCAGGGGCAAGLDF